MAGRSGDVGARRGRRCASALDRRLAVYLVWVRRLDGDRLQGRYSTLPEAVRACRRLYAGYVTGPRSWAWLYAQGC